MSDEYKYIECECRHELIQLQKDPDESLLYLAMYSFGQLNKRNRLDKNIIKNHIKQIKKKGHPWADQLILNRKTAQELRDYLTEFLNEPDKGVKGITI